MEDGQLLLDNMLVLMPFHVKSVLDLEVFLSFEIAASKHDQTLWEQDLAILPAIVAKELEEVVYKGGAGIDIGVGWTAIHSYIVLVSFGA